MSDVKLPLPNQQIAGLTVVASVWMNDDAEHGPIYGLLLLLRGTPPFFEIAEIVWTAQHGWRVNEGTRRLHYNIVPAVDDYKDSGGDY
jgi:hypothetical protein